MSRHLYSITIIIYASTLFSLHAGAQRLKQDSLYRFSVAAYLSAGKIDSAIYTAKRLNSKRQENQKDLLLAILYEKKKDYTTSDAYFKKAFAASKADTAKIYAMQSMASYHRANNREAKNRLLLSIRHDSSNAQNYFLLGRLYAGLQQEDSALIAFQNASRLDGDNLLYTQAVYQAYQEKGMIQASFPYLEKWAARDNLPVQTGLVLVSQLMDLDAFGKAMILLQRLALSAPSNDTIMYNLGVCALEMADTMHARIWLRRAVSLSVQPNPLYFEKLIEVYEAGGDLSAIILLMKEGATRQIAFCKGWLTNYYASKKEQQRLDSLSALNTDGRQVQRLLGSATIACFQKDDALALRKLAEFKLAGGRESDTSAVLEALAYMGWGKLAEARTVLEKRLSANSSGEAVINLYSTLLLKMKDYGKLITVLDQPAPSTMVATSMDNRTKAAILFKAYTIRNDLPNALKYHRRE